MICLLRKTKIWNKEAQEAAKQNRRGLEARSDEQETDVGAGGGERKERVST